MDKKQVIAAWLTQKFSTNPTEINEFLFEHAQEALVALPEFQGWLKTQQAQLKAQSTPEALEAQKLQAAEELKKQDDAIKELIVE